MKIKLTENQLQRILKEMRFDGKKPIEFSDETVELEQDNLGETNKVNEGDRNTRNYMFFSNLKQMRRQIDMMLENLSPHWVDSLLCDGHDWADDKISESKTNIDSVFDFFMNKKEE